MDDDLDTLVEQALARIETEGPSALDEVCADHPARADALRERIRLLGDYGLLHVPDTEAGLGPPADEAGRRLGDFRIIRRLGGGGMGVVYLAEQESLGREVALKLIRSDQLDHPAARQRFRREVDLVARLKHPAIVPIHAVGEADGMPYFAMERIEGCSLEALLDALRDQDPVTFDAGDLPALVARLTGGGATPDPEWRPPANWRRFCLETTRTVARALEHAHQRGVLHRDVKPSNVMVATDGRVFLADFGLGQASDDATFTKSGSVIGSLPYLSPERVRGESGDARADVFGLGATLYELLTFRAPYRADSAELLATRIVEGPPASPRRANRRLSKDDETVVLTALESSLERRYPSAVAFAEDLDALLHHREIHARPIGPIVRAARFTARHPGPTLAGLLALLLFVVAPIAFSIWQVRANERLTVAFERAVHERGRAARNLRSAQKAVELILHETASQMLPDIPQMAAARERLLKNAVAFYEPLLAQRPKDRGSRFELAMMRRSLGDLYGDLSRHDEAMREYELQVTTLEALRQATSPDEKADPTLPELHVQLGATHAQMGRVAEDARDHEEARRRYRQGIAWFDRSIALGDPGWRMWVQRAKAYGGLAQLSSSLGDSDAAFEALREGLRSAESAHDLRPDQPNAIETLGALLGLAGRLHSIESRHDEAGVVQRRAIELLRPLAEDGGGVLLQNTLTSLLQNHGIVLLKLGRMDDAEPVLRECLRRAEQLAAAFPENNHFTRLVADSLNALGLIYSNQGRLEAEKDAYERAVGVHRSARDRGSFEALDALGVALTNLATTHRAGGDLEAAVAALEESLALFDEGERLAPGTPYRPRFRQGTLMTLAQVRAEQGRYDDAALILRDLAAQELAEPRILHGCAEVWMRIAELADGPLAGAAPREALEALRHALRLGYDDLDALRASPSLETLLADPTLEGLLRDAGRP